MLEAAAVSGYAVTTFYSLFQIHEKNGGYVKSLPSLNSMTGEFLSLLLK